MNGYQVANLVLDLIGIGLKAQAIREQLDAARAAGMPESEIPTLLNQWYDEARQEALMAQSGNTPT